MVKTKKDVSSKSQKISKTSKKESNDLKIKSPRFATGVPNFDKLIEGGFAPHSINLLIGDSGSGKTIFAMQSLIEGLEKKEKCLYITFEEKKQEFYENMQEFGWDLEAYEKSGDLYFLEYSPEKVKVMLEEGGGTVENIILSKKITRIVIDSITAFELLFDNETQRREATLELFSMLKKWNCVSVITYEEDPLKLTSTKAIEFESDAVIAFYLIRTTLIRDRFIEILKMRATNHSREIYPFKISEKGVIIDPKPYSGILF